MHSKIIFHLTRLYVFFFVFWKKLTGDPWKKVEGIYLPITNDIGFSTLRWIINGKYEAGEIRIIKTKLHKGDIVLEIGTGLGFVAAFCCKRTGPENVYTFEANPENVKTAVRVFDKNTVNPFQHNALLAEQEGFIEFPVNKKNRLASSLFDETENMVLVPVICLNDFIEDMKPDFLIMDIEGAEYDIFKIIHFQTIRKIQFELHPTILGSQKCLEIFMILEEAGFKKDYKLSDDHNFYYQK